MSTRRQKDPPAPVMAGPSMIASDQQRLAPVLPNARTANIKVPVTKVQEEEEEEAVELPEQANSNSKSNKNNKRTILVIEEDVDPSTLASFRQSPQSSFNPSTQSSFNPSTLTTSAEKPPAMMIGATGTSSNKHNISTAASAATPDPSHTGKGYPHPHPDDPSVFSKSEYSEALTPLDQDEYYDSITPLPSAREISGVNDIKADISNVQVREGVNFDRLVSGLTTHVSGLTTNGTPPGYYEKGNSGSGIDGSGGGRSKGNRTICMMVVCCIFLVAAAIVPIVVCGVLGECSSSSSNGGVTVNATDTTNATTVSPTESMMTMPPIITTVPPRPGVNSNPGALNNTLELEDRIRFVEIELGTSSSGNDNNDNSDNNLTTLVIPEYTLQAFDDALSPQSKAYLWLVYTSTPERLAAMPMWRRQQLFALAAFFFAFRGARWSNTNQQEWLNPTMNECDWSTDIICYFEAESAGMELLPPQGDGGSDGDGQADLQGKVRAIQLNNFVAPIELATGIPPEMELLQWMQELDLMSLEGLQDTTLDDFLPLPQLANMPNLLSIRLSDNRLMGTLPSELGIVTQLQSLELTENPFTGTLPSELGLLTELEYLWLDGTDLTGVVPEPLCELTVMRKGVDLDIDCDQLTCPVTDCNCDCARQEDQNEGEDGTRRKLILW